MARDRRGTPQAHPEGAEAVSASRCGREPNGASRRPAFEDEQPRLRFDDMVEGDVSERLPVDAPRREKRAGPQPAAPWREVDADVGAPVIVCPGCWPEMAARVKNGPGVEVRVLDERPAWARCGVCDPEDVC